MALNINDIGNNKSEATSDGNTESFLNKDLSFGFSSFGEKYKEQLYSGLSTLVESGIDLNRSLEIMTSEFSKKGRIAIVEELVKRIQQGDSLSDAMENHSQKSFSIYEIATVRIGEEVGKIAHVMKELQLYYKGSIKRRRMLTSALSYPILVCVIAVFAVIFMMTFVVPMFEDVFKRFDGELPEVTKFVIGISTFVNEHLWMLLIVLAGLAVVIRFASKNTKIRYVLSQVLLRIPVIGPFVVKTYLSKLSGVLGMMIGSGVHLLKALHLAKDAVGFLPYQRALEKIIAKVETGGSLHEGLTNRTLFPNKFASLVKVGEEVNKLDYFFDKANNEYNEELEHSTVILGAVLEPILLVFLGGAIGVILVAMYLPLFDLSSQW